MLFGKIEHNRKQLNTYEKGGLHLGYFSTLNNTFKNVIQLKWYTKKNIWYTIPLHILSKLGGLNFFPYM